MVGGVVGHPTWVPLALLAEGLDMVQPTGDILGYSILLQRWMGWNTDALGMVGWLSPPPPDHAQW